MSNDALSGLLAGETAERRAEVLEGLLARHSDPQDPLYEYMRLFKLTLGVNEQTVKVSEEIPLQLQALLEEIDARFDQRLGQWRGVPVDVTRTVADAIAGALPEVATRARETARGQVDEAVDAALREHRERFAASAREVLEGQAAAVRAQTSRVHPERLRLQVRLNTLLLVIVVFVGGLGSGLGWAAAHPNYPPSVRQLIDAGEQYETMYRHMPVGMQTWVKNWMHH